MKRTDLDLDTIYADRDGHSLMLLSLDKFAVLSRSRYVPDRHAVRTPRGTEVSGVLVIRQGYYGRDHNAIRAASAQLRAAGLPTRQRAVEHGEIVVMTLGSIASTWEDHQAAQRAAGEARHAANLRERETKRARAQKIARVKRLIPSDVTGYVSMGEHTDKVELRLDTMLDILERLGVGSK